MSLPYPLPRRPSAPTRRRSSRGRALDPSNFRSRAPCGDEEYWCRSFPRTLATLAPQVFLEKIGTNILHPHMGLVNENLMDQARARGWTVYAWAPMVGEEEDREGTWAALKTFGLHGLCTNYPRQFKRWL